MRTEMGKEIASVCNFCAIGCGLIATVHNGEIINVEGNPDNPLNEGGLCSKGQAVIQEDTSPLRQTRVLYRAPGAAEWEEKDWDWALDRIAERIKETRDSTFEHKNADGTIVNRTEAIASFGSAVINNEENYLLVKLMRALGLVYIEHQARI